MFVFVCVMCVVHVYERKKEGGGLKELVHLNSRNK